MTKQEYNSKRLYCPKCGSSKHMCTMMGFLWNNDKPEEYKDLNKCTCEKCGDKHVYHDRVLSNGTGIHTDIHDEIRNMMKGDDIDIKMNNFNDYLEQFIDERNNGLLRTVLVIGKSFKNNPIVKDRLEIIAQQLRDLHGGRLV
jgi:transcription elongation factor Elf1